MRPYAVKLYGPDEVMECGKEIRTTGNHPYLVKRKDIDRSMVFEVGVIESVVVNHHGQNDQAEYAKNAQHHNHFDSFLSTANIRKMKIWIAKILQNHNASTFESGLAVADFGIGHDVSVDLNSAYGWIPLNGRASCGGDARGRQSTGILRELLLKLSSFPLFVSSPFLRINDYSHHDKDNTEDADENPPQKGKLFKKITGQPDSNHRFSKISDGFSNKFDFPFRNDHGVSIAEEKRLSKGDLGFDKVTRRSGRWVKVAALQEGDTIAVLGADGIAAWEKIVAIECLPPEQVWDIEVEGTHNFVAGHYVNRKTAKALSPEEEEAYLRRVKGGG